MARIEGKITIDGITTEFYLGTEYDEWNYHQWGGNDSELSHNVGVIQVIVNALREHVPARDDRDDES